MQFSLPSNPDYFYPQSFDSFEIENQTSSASKSKKSQARVKKNKTGIAKTSRDSYKKVSNQARSQLIFLVESCHLSLKAATEALEIKYSTGKSILTLYRKEGRILKKINCSESSSTSEQVSVDSPVMAMMGQTREPGSKRSSISLSPALEQFCSTVASSNSSDCDSEVEFIQNSQMNYVSSKQVVEGDFHAGFTGFEEAYSSSEEGFFGAENQTCDLTQIADNLFETNCNGWNDSTRTEPSTDGEEDIYAFESMNKVFFE